MFRQALSLYRRHFAALVVTAAVALLPADFLAAGAVRLGVAGLAARGFKEPATVEDVKIGPSTDARAERARQLGKESVEGSAAIEERLRPVLPLLYAAVILVVLMMAGIVLAHAALAPLVLDLASGKPSGAAQAWAAVAGRFGALAWTWLLGLALIAVGSLFCLVPGIVLAAGFSFAAPVTVLEDASGRAALERSWSLLKGRWLRVMGLFALLVLFTAAGSWVATLTGSALAVRMAASALVRLLTYPLPLAALVLLYAQAREEEGQYIRRSSAPG